MEDPSEPVETGIALAVVALLVQSIRNLCFNGLWMIGIHTGKIMHYFNDWYIFDEKLTLFF